MKPSVLFIVPADYDELREKGVEGMILERDEEGYFDKVFTVHPIARTSRSFDLNSRHQVHEVGFDLLPGGRDIWFFRVLQYPTQLVRTIFRVVSLVRTHRISLIRANDPFWMGLIGLIGSRICGVPYCISIHADYDKMVELNGPLPIATVFGSYRAARYLSRMVLSKAAMVMPISSWLAAKAIAAGAIPEKVRVIPHGMDLSPLRFPPSMDPRERFKLEPSRRIVSVVGRLSREKYVYDVIEIARELSRSRDDFVMLLAGGGPEEARIRAILKADESLSRCVVLLGFQSRQVCIDIARAADVSLCLLAGFGLIEACAAGAPVIAYDVEWNSELIKDGETGFLVRENDVHSAAARIAWFIDHRDQALAIGRAARDVAMQRHDIRLTSEVKVRCYAEILGHRASD